MWYPPVLLLAVVVVAAFVMALARHLIRLRCPLLIRGVVFCHSLVRTRSHLVVYVRLRRLRRRRPRTTPFFPKIHLHSHPPPGSAKRTTKSAVQQTKTSTRL